jgi:hypothetical protein
VGVEIQDAAGAPIRAFDTPAREGLNRAVWDLRYDPPRQVALRTTPPDNPHIWEEARFKGETTRPIVHWGIQQPQRNGPIAAPGKYTVKLTANGRTLTQPFEVLKDPAIPSPDEDLAASTRAQIRIRDDMNQAVDMINSLESIGRQLEDQIKANRANAAVSKALADLEKKRMDVVLQLLSRTELHSDDKWYVEPYKVYLNLVWLIVEVGTGASDVAGGAEFRPTDAQLVTLAEQEKELATARAMFEELLRTTLPEFNRLMAGRIAPISDGSSNP